MASPQPTPPAYEYTAPPELGNVINLSTFLTTAGQLTLDDQKLVVDQALTMIESTYVHLPMKRAIHAIDPVQALRLLQRRLAARSEAIPERTFHNGMIEIFVSLRDLHTNYVLPSYFSGSTAILPFYLEEVADEHNKTTEYVVSKVMDGFSHPQFQPGVTVKYWNGVPVVRAVEVNGELNAGNNPAARHARGLEAMTVRPMAMSLPPDEEWVLVGCEKGGQTFEIRIPWMVFQPDAANSVALPNPAGTSSARVIGMDFQTEMVRRTKVRLFVPEVADRRRRLTGTRLAGEVPQADAAANPLPDTLNCRTVDTPSGKFGYLRIFSFAPPDQWDVDTFLTQFFSQVVTMIKTVPPDGLIVDVRGNGGGVILAGEMLLQLFTPWRITPERFDFINSPLTLQLTRKYSDLKPWAESISQAVETAAVYSQGYPLTSDQDANSMGQQYQGPVVLITDALIYSTTDIFTAGFRDHNIGKILGTSANVGAGGANVWDYMDLQQNLPEVFKPLPKGTSMRVAMRRATRVGEMTGIPLEELGVVPDEFHQMTRNDVFHDNVDLIAHAARMLAGHKLHKLDGRIEVESGKRSLIITSGNLSRVDVYLNGRPALSLDVKDGDTLPGLTWGAGNARIHLEGYDGDEFVVARDLPSQA